MRCQIGVRKTGCKWKGWHGSCTCFWKVIEQTSRKPCRSSKVRSMFGPAQCILAQRANHFSELFPIGIAPVSRLNSACFRLKIQSRSSESSHRCCHRSSSSSHPTFLTCMFCPASTVSSFRSRSPRNFLRFRICHVITRHNLSDSGRPEQRRMVALNNIKRTYVRREVELRRDLEDVTGLKTIEMIKTMVEN